MKRLASAGRPPPLLAVAQTYFFSPATVCSRSLPLVGILYLYFLYSPADRTTVSTQLWCVCVCVAVTGKPPCAHSSVSLNSRSSLLITRGAGSDRRHHERVLLRPCGGGMTSPYTTQVQSLSVLASRRDHWRLNPPFPAVRQPSASFSLILFVVSLRSSYTAQIRGTIILFFFFCACVCVCGRLWFRFVARRLRTCARLGSLFLFNFQHHTIITNDSVTRWRREER